MLLQIHLFVHKNNFEHAVYSICFADDTYPPLVVDCVPVRCDEISCVVDVSADQILHSISTVII